MTHESETAFREEVAADLAEMYGEEAVEQTKHLDVSGRVVDIYVQTPDGADDLAIEVENDFEATFEGHGQTSLYAHQLDAHPILLIPEGHIEFPEAFYLAAEDVTIFQYPTE